MDEQRIEAYVNLIQQLLGCESGTENAIFVGIRSLRMLGSWGKAGSRVRGNP
jgi:hypothetical protein